MTNRREFLQIGVTATAWPLVARAAEAAGIDRGASWTPLAAVVYDTRFDDSIAFAERSRALGLKTHPIDADMTRLWYEEIYHQWRRGPTALAGLTAYGPMFCFAELARDVRMRVVFRAEHRITPGRGPTHAFTGPTSMLSDAVKACAAAGPFGVAMADVVARCPTGRHEITAAQIGVGLAEPDEHALYTWIIAPAVQA
jgi:hypothetical protein